MTLPSVDKIVIFCFSRRGSVNANVKIPLFGFGFPALVAGLISFAILSIGILFLFIYPGQSLVTLFGASALFTALSLFLYFLGIICHLIYRSGNLKIENLYRIKFK